MSICGKKDTGYNGACIHNKLTCVLNNNLKEIWGILNKCVDLTDGRGHSDRPWQCTQANSASQRSPKGGLYHMWATLKSRSPVKHIASILNNTNIIIPTQ